MRRGWHRGGGSTPAAGAGSRACSWCCCQRQPQPSVGDYLRSSLRAWRRSRAQARHCAEQQHLTRGHEVAAHGRRNSLRPPVSRHQAGRVRQAQWPACAARSWRRRQWRHTSGHAGSTARCSPPGHRVGLDDVHSRGRHTGLVSSRLLHLLHLLCPHDRVPAVSTALAASAVSRDGGGAAQRSNGGHAAQGAG